MLLFIQVVSFESQTWYMALLTDKPAWGTNWHTRGFPNKKKCRGLYNRRLLIVSEWFVVQLYDCSARGPKRTALVFLALSDSVEGAPSAAVSQLRMAQASVSFFDRLLVSLLWKHIFCLIGKAAITANRVLIGSQTNHRRLPRLFERGSDKTWLNARDKQIM